jgi:hypothetical protein
VSDPKERLAGLLTDLPAVDFLLTLTGVGVPMAFFPATSFLSLTILTLRGSISSSSSV